MLPDDLAPHLRGIDLNTTTAITLPTSANSPGTSEQPTTFNVPVRTAADNLIFCINQAIQLSVQQKSIIASPKPSAKKQRRVVINLNAPILKNYPRQWFHPLLFALKESGAIFSYTLNTQNRSCTIQA